MFCIQIQGFLGSALTEESTRVHRSKSAVERSPRHRQSARLSLSRKAVLNTLKSTTVSDETPRTLIQNIISAGLSKRLAVMTLTWSTGSCILSYRNYRLCWFMLIFHCLKLVYIYVVIMIKLTQRKRFATPIH